MDATPSGEPSAVHCAECGSPLAHDQRYCIRCGARRGALPRPASDVIGAILARGRTFAAPRALDDEPAVADPHWYDAWLGAPRAAAVAVMSMLGFGVIVGSLVGESAANGVQQLIVALAPHSSPATAPGRGGVGGAGGGSDSSGGGTQTITVGSTTPGPGPAPTAQPSSAGAAPSSNGTPPPIGGTLPPIKHVFMIVLSSQGYNQTFGHTANDPYLAKTLAAQGEVVQNYYAVAGGPLANEIALVSGQGPTQDTVNDCPVYGNVAPGTKGARGQVLGNGCVYPKKTATLAAQLTAARLTWKAYVQTPGSGNRARLEACRHPKLGSPDTQPTAQEPYATWRNPFLYFHSLINGSACPENDASLSQFAADLKSRSTTPALSYVIPDLCHDGVDAPCAPNAPSGMLAADAFLRSVVPRIERSPAYKADGLIAITFDNAPQTGPGADSTSCCANPTYPDVPSSSATTTPTSTSTPPTTTTDTTTTTSTSTTATTTTGTSTVTPASPNSLGGGQTDPSGGGGQVGLLLISQYVKPGQMEVTDYYNHFSLLASLENLFGLGRLGYASDAVLPVFGTAVYDNYSGG